MNPLLVTLFQNAALLLAMMVVFDLVTSRKAVHGKWRRQVLTGIVLGGLTIGLMLASFRLETGIIFDTRSVLLSLSGLFFGPITTVAAMAMAGACRFWQGGIGVWAGIWVILATGGMGILWRHYRQERLADISLRELYGFGIVVHLVMLALMLTLPRADAWRVLSAISLPVLLVYPLATLALGWLLAGRLQREKTLEAMAASEARYRSLFEATNVGKSVTLPTGEIQVNQAFCDMLGYGQEELRQKTWQELTPAEEISPINDLLSALLDGGKGSVRFEKRYLHKNGSNVWADVSATVQRDKDGNPLHFITTVVDITERESLEAQLRQAQKLESVGRLAGGVAHDFNNILTTIIGTAELMLGDVPADAPLRNDIQEIKAAGERAASLTRQLLAFSRKQVLQPEVINLNDTIQSMTKMLRRMLPENIEVQTALAEDLDQVEADEGQIEQVVMNLAINARDAMPAGGRMTIETVNVDLDETYARSHASVNSGSFVMLSVSDTGIGMSKEVQEQVFEPFFTTKDQGKGTGLGLSTVYGIVKQSNGSIWVYSEPDKGTTIKIYLPRVETSRPEARDREKDVPDLTGAETILVVEDDAQVRGLAVKSLKGYGYTVLTAENSAEAFKVAADYTDHIHLVLTDVVMPGMNGKEMAEQLKAARPEMLVLYMSGYTDNAIVHHGVLDPGVPFIGKPFTPAALGRKVREVLDS